MCMPSKPKMPPPPPIPAPPATEVNAGQATLRDRAPKTPQVATGTPTSAFKKRGKAALRIPLDSQLVGNSVGVNIP